ncbi:hypothetical protein LEP1GSC127_1809 [Leptospira kirschneri str. 200801925]|nr:hypothetical protein LEP1GSC127_1809 [Leptospira kirschneri str. 200801925]
MNFYEMIKDRRTTILRTNFTIVVVPIFGKFFRRTHII